MIKAAFFDMDGTISAPKYINFGKAVVGFSPENWIAYCNLVKNDTYKHCKVVEPILEFARQLKKNGTHVYILTMSLSQAEIDAKRVFIRDHALHTIFEECIFVDTNDEKIDVIRQYAKQHYYPLTQCMLVEDTYTTLLKTAELGIKSVHVSNIIANNMPT